MLRSGSLRKANKGACLGVEGAAGLSQCGRERGVGRMRAVSQPKGVVPQRQHQQLCPVEGQSLPEVPCWEGAEE